MNVSSASAPTSSPYQRVQSLMSRVEATAIELVTPNAKRAANTPSRPSVAPRPPGKNESAPARVVADHRNTHSSKLASTPGNALRISQ